MTTAKTNPQSDAVMEVLDGFDQDVACHLELAEKMFRAFDGATYPLDVLAAAAINRSINLARGFRQMIASRNMICGGALLRLEMDTAFRFAASWFVPDPHAFATEVLKGTRIQKLKDRDGDLLTDRHLVTLLSPTFPWIDRVYERTCSYVHLSETHMHTVLRADGGSEPRFRISVGSGDPADITDQIYLEAVAAFRECTSILRYYVEGWVLTKSHPELIEKGRVSEHPPA
ncbi:MAG: hypothetical protein U0575_09200 [Phycisphaerales bacterium]